MCILVFMIGYVNIKDWDFTKIYWVIKVFDEQYCSHIYLTWFSDFSAIYDYPFEWRADGVTKMTNEKCFYVTIDLPDHVWAAKSSYYSTSRLSLLLYATCPMFYKHNFN